MSKQQKLPKSKQNSWRKERKAARRNLAARPGKCGSSWCSRMTGCEPWKPAPPARRKKISA